MAGSDDERVRTEKWVRRNRPAPAPREPGALTADVPAGRAPQADALADATRAALAGWPIIVLRVIGKVEGRVSFGRHPGRWARREVGAAIDQLCICPGLRCRFNDCPAGQILGRHGKGNTPDGEAWSPLTIRANDLPEGRIEERSSLRMEIVLAGREATGAFGQLVGALQNLPEPEPRAARVSWTTFQSLVLGEDEELRWRKIDLDAAPPLLPLERLREPKVRPHRLVLTFLSATPIARVGEQGQPSAELSLMVDRMSRTLGAWMGRTGHKGPRLPVDDLLRAAAAAELVADHSRAIEVPGILVGASGARAELPERVPAMTGSITWTGDFAGLAPLLRAIQTVGMGPGRQHGLGQIAIR